MKKIVIPTDFSETSMNAIKYAMQLFKYDRCEFTIMHAFADEVYETSKNMDKEEFKKYKQSFQQKTDKTLKKEIDEMLKISPNPRHKYNHASRFGSLVDETNRIIEEENIDIVIMGTKGKTNNKNITFGSNTLQVIKYVKCPVLAVPIGYNDIYPKNIVFPTDYMVPFKRRELKLLSTLAMNFVATITFLYVSEYKGLSYRQLDNREFLDCCFTNNKTSYIQISGKDLTKTINQTITDHNIDMLVMVNERHSYLENILYRSTIEKIGLEIKIPFLVLQNLYRQS